MTPTTSSANSNSIPPPRRRPAPRRCASCGARQRPRRRWLETRNCGSSRWSRTTPTKPEQAGKFDNPGFVVSVTNMESGTEQRRGYRMVARAKATAALRERIVDSTERLFEELASDRFSLDDVATGAGTTVQTVLRHFGSKDQLLRATMARG